MRCCGHCGLWSQDPAPPPRSWSCCPLSPLLCPGTVLGRLCVWSAQCVCVCVLVAQLCLTICSPVDCSLPGSSVHGIFPGKNTRVGCHSLRQMIFLTQGSNPSLLPCRQILYHLSHQGSPEPPQKPSQLNNGPPKMSTSQPLEPVKMLGCTAKRNQVCR